MGQSSTTIRRHHGLRPATPSREGGDRRRRDWVKLGESHEIVGGGEEEEEKWRRRRSGGGGEVGSRFWILWAVVHVYLSLPRQLLQLYSLFHHLFIHHHNKRIEK